MKKLLFITIDSLGQDLIDKSDAVFIKSIMRTGNTIENLRTAFPSLTTPMMTTILTGKYPEDHGIYSNSIYDYEKNKVIGKLRDVRVPTISEILMKAGYRTLSVQHFMLENRCNKYVQVDGSKPQNNTNTIIGELEKSDYDAVFTIYQSVDSIGHKYGSLHRKRIEELEKVDHQIEKLFNFVTKKWGNFLLVINSDHSMSTYKKRSKFSIISLLNKHGLKSGFYEPGQRIPQDIDCVLIRQPTVQIYLKSEKGKKQKNEIIYDLESEEDVAKVYDEYELAKLHNPYLCDIAYTLKKGYTNNFNSLLLAIKSFGYHGTFEESNAIASFYGGSIKQDKLKDYDLTVITPKTLEYLGIEINLGVGKENAAEI
ncbi:MAG TPA: alkaline phosphatase family protein [Defluviitoga sp.]|nr:alkaline phosphatase family protein [Defluviitoga sp.]HOP23762.1 alkaline phosphatase family protein [Defluviitoga sp.]HPZ28491.1 alkaline phosphatase family protein [Defluviitoga sp.]HQD62775.1 alkaline phosphatase family protein [Defluviitoga sp.]